MSVSSIGACIWNEDGEVSTSHGLQAPEQSELQKYVELEQVRMSVKELHQRIPACVSLHDFGHSSPIGWGSIRNVNVLRIRESTRTLRVRVCRLCCCY